MKLKVASIFLIITLCDAQINPYFPITEFRKWKLIDVKFPSQSIRKKAIDDGTFVPKNVIPIDIDVDYKVPMQNSRIFVTLPRFSTGSPVTLGYIQGDSQQIRPYPNYNWHWPNDQNCDEITSVLRIAIDKCKQLWVLDAGKIGDDWKCNPQLLVFDLKTDTLVKKYVFDRKLYTNESLFATPVLDVRDSSCKNVKVYIADTTVYSLIVYDLQTNNAWKINNDLFRSDPNQGNFTIAGESFELFDGILGMAITKTSNAQFQEPNLIFHALASTTENAVPLSVLNNRAAFEANPNALADQFRTLGSRGVKTAAQAMDRNGNLFFVLWDPLAIVCWDSSTPYNRDNIKILYRNNEILQFASGVKVVKNLSGEEDLWLVTNRLQKFWTNNVAQNEYNYRILTVSLKLLLGPMQKCAGVSLSLSEQINFPNLFPPNLLTYG